LFGIGVVVLLFVLGCYWLYRLEVGTRTVKASLQTSAGIKFEVTRWENIEFDHWHLDVIDGPTNIVTHAFLGAYLHEATIQSTVNGKAVEIFATYNSNEPRLMAFFDLMNRKLWTGYINGPDQNDVLSTNLTALKAQCGVTD
jgi:hypothetical protein